MNRSDFHVPTLIARKRDGLALSAAEIRFLIDGFVSGTVADYQMSALAMAIVCRGMDAGEISALTLAMLESGERMRHPAGPPVVDKHSTGGIGDKVSLVLAPLVAASGVRIPMVSGRGLGITGGTLDKLDAIPGFRTRLSLGDAAAQLDRLGVVMMGQTDEFCPADRKLYSLRDVTGTVPSVPLITASIMSKKLAESLDRLVLDVKFGSGAFMKSRAQAEELAASMISVGENLGVAVTARLTSMDEPLGRSVGNALEVIEALGCLEGGGPPDLRELVLDLAAEISPASRTDLARRLDDGSARRLFNDLVAAQGGDPTSLPRLADIHRASFIVEVPSPGSGIVVHADAGIIGQAALELGAGRQRAEDLVDPAVGFDRLVKVGDHIEVGEPLGRIHARTETDAAKAAVTLLAAIQLAP